MTLGSAIAFTFGWHVHEKVKGDPLGWMGVVFFFLEERFNLREQNLEVEKLWQKKVGLMKMRHLPHDLG